MGDNIKMDFQEVGYGGMERVDLAYDRNSCWAAIVNAVMKCGEFIDKLQTG